jgi:hypothetical protein
VTWIAATADSTLLKLDESLINAQSLAGASICANQHHVVLLPTHQPPAATAGPATSSFHSLCIARQAGLAIKNPPKKNHLKKPLKMGYFGFF